MNYDDAVEAYIKVYLDLASKLDRIAEQLAGAVLNTEEWRWAVDAALLRAHTDAYVVGRTYAGLDGPEQTSDFLVGSMRRDREIPFLMRFQDAIERGDPRYIDIDTGNVKFEGVNSRLQLYGRKLRATAELGHIKNTYDQKFIWKLGAAEHCADCVYMASINPYTRRSLWTVPGDGDTECLTNCRCRILIEDDGSESFPGVKRDGTIVPVEDED